MKKTINFFITTLLIIFLATSAYPVFSAEPKKEDKNDSIRITSDNMTANNKKRLITFKGKVVTKRGDSTIYSDILEIYYKDKKEGGKNDKKENKKSSAEKKKVDTAKMSNDISKILAIGNVRIEQGERQATGERAEYFEDQKKIVLTGNPVAWEKGNKVTGTEMIFFIDRDESIIKGNKERRVNVTIFPDKKEGEPKK